MDDSMDDFAPPSENLLRFCKLLDNRPDLQAQTKEAKTAKQIIETAVSNGCDISYYELRFWSKELKATYFPWSEMGKEWRRNFFS